MKKHQTKNSRAPTTKYADLVDQHPLMLFFGSVTSLAGVWWMSYHFLNTYSVITFCLPMKYETQPKEAEEVVKMAIDSTLVKQGRAPKARRSSHLVWDMAWMFMLLFYFGIPRFLLTWSIIGNTVSRPFSIRNENPTQKETKYWQIQENSESVHIVERVSIYQHGNFGFGHRIGGRRVRLTKKPQGRSSDSLLVAAPPLHSGRAALPEIKIEFSNSC